MSVSSPTLRANAGYALIVRAEHDMNEGRDPTVSLRQAVTLALMHKHLYEYMRDTCARIEELVAQIGASDAREPEADTA